MKKFVFATLLLASITGMASCNYDDSNDIDLLVPGDSTRTTTKSLSPPVSKT